MRRNKPRLVDPPYGHTRHLLNRLGVQSLRTIGQRTEDIAANGTRRQEPLVLDGSWLDGTAGRNLATILHAAGLVIDDTGL
jgi:hypothetical protein